MYRLHTRLKLFCEDAILKVARILADPDGNSSLDVQYDCYIFFFSEDYSWQNYPGEDESLEVKSILDRTIGNSKVTRILADKNFLVKKDF